MTTGSTLTRDSSAPDPNPLVITEADIVWAQSLRRRAALARLGPAEMAEELTCWQRQRARWLSDLEAGDFEDGDAATLQAGVVYAEHKLAELLPVAQREARRMRHPDYPAEGPREDLTARFAAARYADLVGLAETLLGEAAVKSGSRYRTRCPWHDDRRPSLILYEPGRGWWCPVCNKGGDAVAFVADLEHLTMVEALKRVEQLATTFPDVWGAAS
jgi:hypothetical protein